METKGKILVVDDELGIREGCQRALEPQGFSVDKAATMREGLQKLEENDYDLVLLDVMMPDGHGVDLLKPIREKDPDIVCVIITGYATVELAVETIRQGAYDFISKPFTADVLLMTVNQGVERRRLSLEAKRLQIVEREAAELAQAKEAAERLEQQKSAFMVTVAHELRSPVGGAQSLLRTLLRGLAGKLNGQQKEILGRVEVRLSQLMELINDLLTLAASKTFEEDEPLAVVSLQPVIRRLVDQFAAEAGNKQVALLLNAPEKDLTVKATEDGLAAVFTNLIGNALKYTPAGGRVSIDVLEQPRTVACTVADTGIGIPSKDLPRLGEEFFRAGNAKKSGVVGTGLGLSIVKQHVDRFGGALEAKSEEGQGTTFTLTFLKAA